MSAERPQPAVIGWTEYVDLPDWGVKRLRAKVDTGARSSALHVEDIRELSRDHVTFSIVLHRAKRDRRIAVKTRIARRGRVRSSTGHREDRYFVETTLRLGSVEKKIEISLVDRQKLIHRMLLGRSALTGSFLIDVGHRMLATSRPKRRPKKRRERKHA